MAKPKRLRNKSISSDSEGEGPPTLSPTQIEQISKTVVQLLIPVIETTIRTIFQQLQQQANTSAFTSALQQQPQSQWRCPPNLMPPHI